MRKIGHRACAAAETLEARRYADQNANISDVRGFFEHFFTPVEIIAVYEPTADGGRIGAPSIRQNSGLFTGYFEPLYDGALERGPKFLRLYIRARLI